MEKTKNAIIGIYKITSPSGKIYIGQTTNWRKRTQCYNRIQYSGIGPKLYNSLIKYGPENHIFELIEECSNELLNEREIYWGKFYDVLGENGLNLKELGIGGKWNDEMKVKFKIQRNSPE